MRRPSGEMEMRWTLFATGMAVMGLRFARGNFRENLARGWIDHIDGVRKLGGDVEQTVGPEFGAMRAERFAQIDRCSELAFLQINHVNRAAVRPGLPDARVSVDRNVGEASVIRYDDFMAVHPYCNFCEFAAIVGIDHQQTACRRR